MNRDNNIKKNKEKTSFESLEQQRELEQSSLFETHLPNPQNKRTKKHSVYFKAVCAFLIVAVLASFGAVALHFLVPPNAAFVDEDKADATETATVNLTKSLNVKLSQMKNPDKKALTNILSIQVKNERDEYTLLPFEDLSGDAKTINFKLDGYDEYPMNTEAITSMSQAVFNLTAVKKLGGDWSDSDCGIDKPYIGVDVDMADNSDFSFYIGDKVPDGSENRYGKTTLSDEIYILSSDAFASFDKSVVALADTELISPIQPDGDNDPYFSEGALIKYDKITLSGSRLDCEIVFTYEESRKDALLYRISKPISTYASDDVIKELIKPISEGLSASAAYVLGPNEKQISRYGLDKPYFQVKYEVKGEKYTVSFSKPDVMDKGYYACMINDVPVIYMFMEELYGFIEYDLDKYRNTMMFVKNIDELKSVRVRYAGTDLVYNIYYEEKVSKTTQAEASGAAETTDTDETEAKDYELSIICNSSPVEAKDFQRMYQRLMLVKAVGYLKIGESAPSGTPYLSLTFNYKDASSSDTIKFTKYNDRYYSYTINDIGDELVRYDTVDEIIEDIEKLKKGETVDSPL